MSADPPLPATVARQLNILSGSVRRLGSDYRSYVAELQSHEAKLDDFLKGGKEEGDLRRQREFVSECEATIADIQLRVQASCQKLQQYFTSDVDCLPGEAKNSAPEVEKARKILSETRAMIEAGSGSGANSSGHSSSPHRVVLCGHVSSGSSFSSLPALLTAQEFSLVTQKTPQIYSQVNAVLLVPGQLETLSEFILALNSLQTPVATALPNRRIFAARQPWEGIFLVTAKTLNLSQELIESVKFVDSCEEFLEQLILHRKSSA